MLAFSLSVLPLLAPLLLAHPELALLCVSEEKATRSRAPSSPDVLLRNLVLQDTLLRVQATSRVQEIRREATHQLAGNWRDTATAAHGG